MPPALSDLNLVGGPPVELPEGYKELVVEKLEAALLASKSFQREVECALRAVREDPSELERTCLSVSMDAMLTALNKNGPVDTARFFVDTYNGARDGTLAPVGFHGDTEGPVGDIDEEEF